MPSSFHSSFQECSPLLLVGLLLLAGCQSCSSPDDPPSAVATEQTTDPRALATIYLRYAYRGALLSSAHPLNDSLSALTAGSMGGQALTVIDTFAVDSVQTNEAGYTVRVRFPRSVQVQSGTWTVSPPSVDTSPSLRIRQGEVYEGPHVVGWSAFQNHLQDVAPAAADTVLPQTATRLNLSTETGS